MNQRKRGSGRTPRAGAKGPSATTPPTGRRAARGNKAVATRGAVRGGPRGRPASSDEPPKVVVAATQAAPRRTVPRLPTPEVGRGMRPLPPAGSTIVACREGYEIDVVEELQLASPRARPRILAPGLLSVEGPLPRRDGRLDLTFARQAFTLATAVQGDDGFAERIAEALARGAPAKAPTTFHWFVPDSDAGNLLSQRGARLGEEVERLLGRALGDRLHTGDPRPLGGQLAQLCLAEEYLALCGALPAVGALSPYPGGRARMHVPARAPSRAAMKLAEALDWLGVSPEPGDTCVDLGAAPGGWTWLLLEMRAKVIAVDPGRLRPDLARHRSVRSIHKSAFDYEPDEPVEWLMCDMAWRPLEVAALLARWGRRRLARTLVANVKLPMKRKAEFVARVREIVATGGWSDVRSRHLYHDREEITLTAWRK